MSILIFKELFACRLKSPHLILFFKNKQYWVILRFIKILSHTSSDLLNTHPGGLVSMTLTSDIEPPGDDRDEPMIYFSPSVVIRMVPFISVR